MGCVLKVILYFYKEVSWMKAKLKLTALAVVAALALGTFGDTVSAKELTLVAPANDSISSEEDAIITEDTAETLQPRAYTVYTDRDLTIYTGSGSARWLHITVYNLPTISIRILMEDYNGQTVWTDYNRNTGTTHWYIGANVRTVKLRGRPSQVSYYNTVN